MSTAARRRLMRDFKVSLGSAAELQRLLFTLYRYSLLLAANIS